MDFDKEFANYSNNTHELSVINENLRNLIRLDIDPGTEDTPLAPKTFTAGHTDEFMALAGALPGLLRSDH